MHLPAFVVALFVNLGVLAAESEPSCQHLKFKHDKPKVAAGLATRVIQSGLTKPRSIKFDSASPPNLLVVESGLGVSVLVPGAQGCQDGWARKVVINNTALNHGLEADGKWLYASSSDVLWMWSYNPTTASVSGQPTALVRNMSTADHDTRTLLLQPPSDSSSGYIIINRGSASNLDADASTLPSGHSQIRRFPLPTTQLPAPVGGYDWSAGELLAWGMRNGVGLSLSPDGSRLWEVENSADDLQWKNQDVHQDNPAEELNVVDLKGGGAGGFYGYPSCFTTWSGMQGLSTGDQFSIELDKGGSGNVTRDDSWCSNSANNVRPEMNFQAHSAPLDITFYAAPSSGDTSYALNKDWDGHAFVSFHGSWNRAPPTGYGVIRVPFSSGAPVASASSTTGYAFVLQAPDLSKCPNGCARPVGLSFDQFGRLFVSSDTTGEVFLIESSTAPDASLAIRPRTLSLRYLFCSLALTIFAGAIY
ncbi:hypothetical protein BOTBODRAFT_53460 [Botryobasidium botryosum FD-172 SS1]|uniref:Pyrroloquinoline quinone-dependent pyranose dehydrogenase beta-propeller domain-containing protein n=1 Tax=Botryobasidium botryosum (strain FD-172 SS1) TaxID=930990 RepID=A0A067MNN9_BOTB1|nr:hypothetical protein BOTBODRAFT_53460 [Botryobasidium botryosum FD-172 SS1]